MKIWLNTNGEVLVDEAGQPYYCSSCPCSAPDEPIIQGSVKTLTIRVDFSWSGFDSDSDLVNIYARWYCDLQNTQEFISMPEGTTEIYAPIYDTYIGTLTRGSGNFTTELTIKVRDSNISEDCDDIDLSYTTIHVPDYGAGAIPGTFTDNTSSKTTCEIEDLEFE